MAKLHLIGNAHLDPVWLWRWQEGFSEILATFRSALDRMKEFPDFKFTSACALYYQWVEKVDKEMFNEIVLRVKEGRWNIVGGWFIQPDCNIPSGESFARHALISQRYFKEKFGLIAKTGYNVDSFGHNAALPKILKSGGLDNYVFMRPFPKEQGRDEDIFLWESDDGTQVPAYRIPMFYNVDLSRMEKFQEIKDRAEEQNTDMMVFYGVGNHGGGPTIKLLEAINELDIPEMEFSTPDDYFKSISKKELPVIKDELQHHARGCYSACTSVKMGNRRCENNLISAEKLCVMAKELLGAAYPQKKLEKAWKNLLFNDFHDILGGCSIKKAYDDAGYLYGEIMSITEQEINFAMQVIAHNIDTLNGTSLPSNKDCESEHWHIWETEGIGTPIVVFNPHTWKVKMPVQVNVVAACVTDCNDREIPFQIVRGDQTNGSHDKMQTIFTAEIEPLGYAVYRVFVKHKEVKTFDGGMIADEHFLENDVIRVEFNSETGEISRIYDKESKKDILSGNCSAILLDETSADTWAHGKTYLGEFAGSFAKPEFSVTENGNIRATLRVKSYFNNSVICRDYSIVPDSKCVKVKANIDFHEKHRTLKFSFPTDIGKTIAKIPFGTITRNNELGEEPCGSWISNGKYVVANDGKYGYDTTKNEIRLSILRSAIYADHVGERDDFCEFMEQGIHECSYMIYPYESNALSDEKAEELNFPLRCLIESFHNGILPLKKSCFNCDNKNIIVTSIKKSEDSDENVIRFYEANGKDSKAELQLFNKSIKCDIGHNAIKTYKTDNTELNLIEWTV